MDIITHTTSGLTIAYAGATIANVSAKEKAMYVLFGALMGALPDLDAISLWSKFDSLFGWAFHESGREIYSSKKWYGHHGFFHSLAAGLLFATLLSLGLKKWFRASFKLSIVLLLASYTVHLAEDLITPNGPWGGIRLFFPAAKYIGGGGYIWWWNNYDLYFIVLMLLVGLLFVNLIKQFLKIPFRLISSSLVVISASLFIIQMLDRPINFNANQSHKTYHELEEISVQYQKETLPPTIFNIFRNFDQSIPLYF